MNQQHLMTGGIFDTCLRACAQVLWQLRVFIGQTDPAPRKLRSRKYPPVASPGKGLRHSFMRRQRRDIVTPFRVQPIQAHADTLYTLTLRKAGQRLADRIIAAQRTEILHSKHRIVRLGIH